MSPQGRADQLLERLAQALADADGEVELSGWAARVGSTRFAASQPTQSGEVESVIARARVIEGGTVGSARAASLEAGALSEAIARARDAARAQRPRGEGSPGFDDGCAPTPAVEAWDAETAAVDAGERAEALRRGFAVADAARLLCAGVHVTVDGAQAVATSAGCRRAYRFTSARLDLTAAGESASGYAGAYGHRISSCDPVEVARRACDRAVAGEGAVELAPGSYDVILEPRAIAEALEWLAMTSLSARPLVDGSSCLSGRIGELVTAAGITLVDDAADPDPAALRAPFDAEGTPKRRVTFIDRGVARGVVTDRASARRCQLPATGHALALGDELAFDTAIAQNLVLAAGEDRIEELVSRVDRGLWVTRFHYVNGLLDTKRALMTGMTRDGLLRIEGGRVVGGARNLRWTESLLEALARVDGISRERRAVAPQRSTHAGGGLLCPTVLLRNFRFSDVA